MVDLPESPAAGAAASNDTTALSLLSPSLAAAAEGAGDADADADAPASSITAGKPPQPCTLGLLMSVKECRRHHWF